MPRIHLLGLAVSLVASVLSLRAQPVSAPQVTLYKLVNYVQTAPDTLTTRGGRVWATTLVSYYVGTSFTMRLTVPGGSFTLQPTMMQLAEYDTDTALARTFPSGVSAPVITTWSGGRIDGSVVIPGYPEPPAVNITNFAELQEWEGGTLEIAWRLPTIPNLPPGAPGSTGFSLYRASEPNFPATAERLYNVTLNPNSTGVRISSLQTAPGETLYGEISYFDVLRGIGWIRFPIHRKPAPATPAIVTQPQSLSAGRGESITLSVSASGPSLSYQWSHNGVALSGATAATLELKNLQLASEGRYTVIVSNENGQIASAVAMLTVLISPEIVSAPSATTVTSGMPASLSIDAAGTGSLSYQWTRNGAAIAAATSSSLIIASALPADAGTYTVVVTNSVGTVTSAPIALTVNPVTRISNLSIRTRVGGTAGLLTVGLTLGGADTSGNKPVLLRAIGPTLAGFGVEGALADPKLALLSGSATIAQNDDWAGNTQVSTTSTAVGAFAFSNPATKDAALLNLTASGSYTVQISDVGTASGIALAEIYDASVADTFVVSTPRLINVSALTQVGTGSDILIAGFNITGVTPKTVLVRAIGPTLGSFGVGGVLADPKLEIYRSGVAAVHAANDNWSSATNATEVSATATRVGAFALTAGSLDATILISLPPGSYTAQVSGANNTTGAALVEVYEVP